MSRENILAAVRQNKPNHVVLPELFDLSPQEDQLLETFGNAVKTSGGACYEVDGMGTVAEFVQNLFPDLKHVYSNLPDTGLNTIPHESIKSPHDLHTVDLSVIKGEFGVAENGAVWITDEELIHRAACFIVQHLVLVVPKKAILKNMLMAYQTLVIKRPGFGCFIAGPSKTADIEQSLVIGAHGARSAVVLLV